MRSKHPVFDSAASGARPKEGRQRGLAASRVSLLLTFLIVCDPVSAQPAAEPLVAGIPATRAHDAGATSRYTLELPADSTYLLTVAQQNLNLIVTVTAPDGTVRRVDSPLARDGSEHILIEQAAAGSYEISISCDELTTVSGGHRIVAEPLPAGPARDAWRAMTRAAEANATGGEAAWQAAVTDYDRAAEIWAGLDESALRAESLFAAAAIDYWQLYAWAPAADRAASAARVFAALGDEKLAANATHLEAASLVEMALELQQSDTAVEISAAGRAQFSRALALLEEARGTHERLGDLFDLGIVTNDIGYTYYNMGLLEEARGFYQQAAAILQSAGETQAEINPRYNLAVLQVEQGFLADAIETFNRILSILPEGQLDEFRSYSLDALGAAELAFGNGEEALGSLSAALTLQVAGDDRQGQGRSLRRIGQTYFSLGEFELAGEYLRLALPVAEQTNDARNQEATLRALGDLAYTQSQYGDALALHRRALETAASIVDRTHLQLLIAQDLRALGQLAEATELAESVLAMTAGSGSSALTAAAELELGWIELSAGELDAAEAAFTMARDGFSQLGLLSELADAKHGLSRTAQRASRLELAAAYGEEALDDLDRMRLRVVSPERRAQLAATRRQFYDTQIDIYMTLYEQDPADAAAHLRAAVETSERARARTITDLIVGAQSRASTAGDDSAERRQNELIEALAEKNHQRDLLLEQQRELDDPAYRQLREDLAALETELDLLEIEMRRADPAAAGGSSSEPLGVAGIQAALGPDTVLLQYFIGEHRSLAFVLSPNAVDVVELADRQTIDTAARAALERLTSYAGETRPLDALAALSSLVLEPVRDRLQGASRIVLALDGALQYVPFAVLPFDAAGEPFLASHDIVEVPSLSSVAALRSRARASAARRTLAVFADPVLTPDDPRLDSVTALPATGAANDFFARSSLTIQLDRLQSSGFEAAEIAALLPESDRLLASGFAASRDQILTTDLRSFRYIHFATHGLVDSRYPGLSALALSAFDARGRPQEGFLRLHDIYELKLDADLVVLSACETALGREIRGEGLLGLTQGFISAGARGVIASLWQVPDRATAELMKRFYSYLIDRGLEPAAALKRAQLDIATENRWRDPYFWGGFVLMGDWR